MAYNGTVNRITGVSPFKAVFHHRVTLPVDMLFPLEKPEGRSMSTHVENLRTQLSRMCEAMTKKQMANFARENKRHQARAQVEFEEGDTCYYFLAQSTPDLSRKLQCHWIGPFTVKRVVSESLVVIYPEGNWCSNPKEIPVIVNRLQKTATEVQTAGDNPFNDIDLQLLVEEQDVGAEHVTYAAAEPELVVEAEEVDAGHEEEQQESGHVPVILSGYPMNMDLDHASPTSSPTNLDLPTPTSDVSIDPEANLEGSPDPPPVWREPCDNVLPIPPDEEEIPQPPQEVEEETTESSDANPGSVAGEAGDPPSPVNHGGGEQHEGETQEECAGANVSDAVDPSVNQKHTRKGRRGRKKREKMVSEGGDKAHIHEQGSEDKPHTSQDRLDEAQSGRGAARPRRTAKDFANMGIRDCYPKRKGRKGKRGDKR